MKMQLTPHPYGSVKEPATVTNRFVSHTKGNLLTFKGRGTPSQLPQFFPSPVLHIKVSIQNAQQSEALV